MRAHTLRDGVAFARTSVSSSRCRSCASDDVMRGWFMTASGSTARKIAAIGREPE
jgi:hypothetical protein